MILDLGIEIISNHLAVHGDVFLLCNSQGHHCHAALLRVHCITDKQNKDAKKFKSCKLLKGLWSLIQGICLIMSFKGECNCLLLCAISCGFWTFSQIAFIYPIHFIITHSFHELVKQNAINNYFWQKVECLISCT